MKDKNKGHVPLLINSLNQWERCEVCGQTKRRGTKWFTKCPGPLPPKKYMSEP